MRRYSLPFDLIMGDIDLELSVSDLTGTPATMHVDGFHLKQNEGGIIDTVVSMAGDQKDTVKEVVASLWADTSDVTIPTFELAGSMTGTDGTKAVTLDFLQPHLAGGLKSFFSTVEEGRRLASDDVTELIKFDLFGGGSLGADAKV